MRPEGFRGSLHACAAVAVHECAVVAAPRARSVPQRVPVRRGELDPSRATMHAEAALVDEAVVVAAELDQVAEVRASAIGPVPDVVGVDVPMLRAARKRAASVTCP